MSRETKNCKKKCCRCCKPKPPKPCLSLSQESLYTLNFQKEDVHLNSKERKYLRLISDRNDGILKQYFINSGVDRYIAKYSFTMKLTGKYSSSPQFEVEYCLLGDIMMFYDFFGAETPVFKNALPFCATCFPMIGGIVCKHPITPIPPGITGIDLIAIIKQGEKYTFNFVPQNWSDGSNKILINNSKCCDINLKVGLPLTKYGPFLDEWLIVNTKQFDSSIILNFYEKILNPYYSTEIDKPQLKILSNDMILKIIIDSLKIGISGLGSGSIILFVNKNDVLVGSVEQNFTNSSFVVFTGVEIPVKVIKDDNITLNLKFKGEIAEGNTEIRFDVFLYDTNKISIIVDNSTICPIN